MKTSFKIIIIQIIFLTLIIASIPHTHHAPPSVAYASQSKALTVAEIAPAYSGFYHWEDNALSLSFYKKGNHDFDIALKPNGVNELFSFDSITYYNLDGTILSEIKACTDYFGPYIFSDLLGDLTLPQRFTGGWHGSSGSNTGTPTAKLIGLEVYHNGTPLQSGDAGSFKALTISFENEVIPYNNDTLPGLSETYQVTVYDTGRFEVSNRLTALTDIQIERYYGPQLPQDDFFSVIEYSQSNNKLTGSLYTNFSIDQCTTARITNDHHAIAVAIYPSGLGQFTYNKQPYSLFSLAYGKTYFSLINNHPVVLKKGETLYWEGYYYFK